MKRILLGFILLFGVSAFAQGVTTSSINGQVKDQNDKALPGANIIATHQPTNTKYGVITDFDGYYRVPNMRVGGPYKIEISYVGFRTRTFDNVFLRLGDTEQFSVELQEEASELDEVTITARKNDIFDSGQTGSNTNVSNREILTLPSATRSLGDFIRQAPEAQVGEDGSISLGGQNNRYNSIYIDGAVQNDVFGLAGSGTNGGQTGVSPISIDAIESFQVNLAPFDVKQSGFVGGSINAITRQGTNNFEGSAYYYIRNEDFAGKTPTAINEDERERLDEFTAELTGARVGGPIIKDKLFFFVNYERQDDETPQPFNFDRYQGDSNREDIVNLRQGLINAFGYDPGAFEGAPLTLSSDKFIARVDWNIDEKNSITVKNSYVEAEQEETRLSGDRAVNFVNGSQFFPTRTNSSTLEWSTTNGSNMSNNLVLAYTDVLDDRGFLGDPFPFVEIQDGVGEINLGSEQFSTVNLLEQKLFTITNNFEYYTGRHKITLGGTFDYFDVKNAFIRQNFGSYVFDSLDDFGTYLDDIEGNEVAAEDYARSYSLLGGVGDSSIGAAEFEYKQLGFYIQDDVDMSDNFKLTFGLRFDIPFFSDGTVNDDFNERTIPILEANGKDLQGARVGQSIDSNVHFSPRVGFNWDVFNDKTTQVRGGIGIFTSRIPLVWPGGAYNNNGVSVGSVNENDLGDNVLFNPDPFGQPVNPNSAPGSGAVGGQIDLFTPDFKLPQVAKFNIAVDQKLPIWDLVASGEVLYSNTINNVFYENLNLKGPVGRLNGADNRPFYDRRDEIDDTYSRIILGTNTDEGYTFNATFKLTKQFDNGFYGQFAYTYGESENIFEGTSSQNSSQWRNLRTVNGKNANPGTARSQFSLGSRVIANAAYEISYGKNDMFKTTLSLFYNGIEGAPFSYIYNDDTDLLNDDSRDNALLYIPRDRTEINLVPITDDDGNIIATPEEQWNQLNTFISNNSYLNDRRGGYAERNGERGPWSHIVDLKLLQDFNLQVGQKTHTLQFSFDIFNFTNFLNKDWGRRKFVRNNVELITTKKGGPDPEFTFDRSFNEDGIVEFDDSGILSSRWQMQFGLRYIFN